MSNSNSEYRKALYIALGLHVVLLLGLILSFSPKSYQVSGTPVKKNIIQAKVIDGAQLKKELRARVEQKIKRQRAIRLTKLRQQRIVQRAKAKKLRQAKAARERQAKLARLKARKRQLAQQQQQLASKLQVQQLQQVKAALAKQQAIQMQGEVDRYKGLILQAISQNWLVPAGVSPDLSCRFLVSLAPGGVVLTVRLTKPSGNDALDQSARVAILKTSPLPVPNNPALFDKFRQLSLTVSPKTLKRLSQ